MLSTIFMYISVFYVLLYAKRSKVTSAEVPQIICRDPRTGGMSVDHNRKFMVYGRDSNEIHGLGNVLLYFPAAYYFSAFTGRDIMLADHGVLGEMCKIVACGFPLVSEMHAAYPDMLSNAKFNNLFIVNEFKLLEYIDGSNQTTALPIVRGYGFEQKSAWWQHLNATKKCVEKLTGCPLGDVGCADRHAFQQLIRGPFKELNPRDLERIKGLPDYLRSAILRLQHSFAPRLDGAVHFRAQFRNFEHFSSVTDPDYKSEVAEWMNSTDKEYVFKSMEAKLVDVITKNRKLLNSSTTARAFVYIASDNEEIKDSFAERLKRNTENRPFEINAVTLNAPFIQHVNSFSLKNNTHVREGFFDLVFDWYALSLSNVILGWRKKYSSAVSTFIHSAQLMSGTPEPPRRPGIWPEPLGRTEGYQLRRYVGITWQPFRNT